MLAKIARWIALHPQSSLAALTIIILVPFLTKPFNIDDPIFIWGARQIQAHPADPYGFTVLWDTPSPVPMWKVTQNPPLASYYIAVAAAILGWSEIALHAAFLLPAAAAIWGTCRLAHRFCDRPALATLAALLTPAFLVSSTSIMCDVPMLAFWVWAMVFWVEGVEERRIYKLFIAGGLAALAGMTKYFGICIVPLVAAYSIAARQPFRIWAPPLLIPLAVFCAYQFAFAELYGTCPLFQASQYATSHGTTHFSYPDSFLIGLSFSGGSFAVLFFLFPLLWRNGPCFAFLGFAALGACAVILHPGLLDAFKISEQITTRIQLAFWVAAGTAVLLLAFVDLITLPGPKSLLLFLWILGTFVFAAFLNWTVNARSLLPMAPALGMLAARRLEQNFKGRDFPLRQISACFAVAALFAVFAMEADSLTAFAVRQNVRAIQGAYGQAVRNMRFEGHWGFQFYMSRLGGSPVNLTNPQVKPGDLVAAPSNNYLNLPLPFQRKRLLNTFSQPGPIWLATVNESLGGCFYGSTLGPLPFVFGQAAPERVFIFTVE
ncbi:MAG TPA: glycosyltransferase family 39 protein [Verrucomicrobiae bacterium]|nr:glycosyltransferase family 39 protein [Verrucomicrobiae bacterium]